MTDLKQQISEVLDYFSKAHPFADTKAYNLYHERAQTKLIALYKKFCGEIIGLDQPLPVDDRDWDCVKHQNQLRTQQRNNLNKLGGIDE